MRPMVPRRRNRELPHDWAWHEQRMAEPHPQAAHHAHRWLAGKRQEMAALDAAPERLRALVHDHNADGARRIWQAEQLAAQKAEPRCPHGRWPPKCAQCLWAASGR